MATAVDDDYTAESGAIVYAGRSGFEWQFDDDDTLYPNASTSQVLATGVPDDVTYYASPDLLPGQTLELVDGVLSLVSDSTLPTTDSTRDVVIEVMDPYYATATNLRTGQVWGHGQSSAPLDDLPYGYARLVDVFKPDGASPFQGGDTIEISPGYICNPDHFDVSPGGANYRYGLLFDGGSGGFINIAGDCTVRNISGRGRWKFFPPGYVGHSNCIAIHRPAVSMVPGSSTTTGNRNVVSISGFDLTGWISNGCGIRLYGDVEVVDSWDEMVESLTLNDFKIGQATGQSLSILSGSAETLLIEDGYIYDGGNNTGQEHNVYCSARTMTFRGVRCGRTRGHSSTPSGPDWSPFTTLEGHVLKVSAVTGVIEGCTFDCVELGDPSQLIQMKAGGNWTIRGNLIIDSKYPMSAQGAITMLRERSFGASGADAVGSTTNGSAYSAGATSITLASAGTGRILSEAAISFAGDATIYLVTSATIANVSSGGAITIYPPLVTPISAAPVALTVLNNPNYEWWAGLEGNSLLFEKNVYISHYPRPIIWFLDPATSPEWTLYASSNTAVAANRRLSSLTIRDNIAMVTGVSATHMISGFPGTNNDKWINLDPNGGTYWDARGNTTVTYDSTEAAFEQRLLKEYTLAAGPVAATAGSVATYRFQWPHGSIARTDAYQGLA
jgi:hypothetical protein